MEIEADILERVRKYETLSRWERQELGRDLRRQGLSYGEIMKLIPVKKSTLATWCREIRLTEEQADEVVLRRTPVPGRTLSGEPYTTHRPRKREVELIKKQARLEAQHLQDDAFWTSGVRLPYDCSSAGPSRISRRTLVGVESSICMPTTANQPPGRGGPPSSIFR